MNVLIIQATDTISGHGTAKGSATERLDRNFSLETSDYDRTLINNKIETKYLESAFGSQRGQTEIEHRIY